MQLLMQNKGTCDGYGQHSGNLAFTYLQILARKEFRVRVGVRVRVSGKTTLIPKKTATYSLKNPGLDYESIVSCRYRRGSELTSVTPWFKVMLTIHKTALCSVNKGLGLGLWLGLVLGLELGLGLGLGLTS